MSNTTLPVAPSAFDEAIASASSSLAFLVTNPTLQDFYLRTVLSFVAAVAIYAGFGAVIHHYFFRDVSKAVYPGANARDIFAWSLSGDVCLALASLAFGSPVIVAFFIAQEKYNFCGLYLNVSDMSWIEVQYLGVDLGGWAYLAASFPVYLLLWDLVFYLLHWLLHWEPVYRLSHKNHHAFRPPVAWSGIAIDPIEDFLSGLFPFFLPLFVGAPFGVKVPFNYIMVYAINVALVAWALILHSACTWKGNWLFMGPVYHNTHHESGRSGNANFGAIFKIYDRMFGTLKDPEYLPAWMQIEEEERQAKAAGTFKKEAATGNSSDEDSAGDSKKHMASEGTPASPRARSKTAGKAKIL